MNVARAVYAFAAAAIVKIISLEKLNNQGFEFSVFD